MTEEDAKTRWCPMARQSMDGGYGLNRDVWGNTVPTASRCLGTACMMWRWDSFNRIDGHCGLAGSPGTN